MFFVTQFWLVIRYVWSYGDWISGHIYNTIKMDIDSEIKLDISSENDYSFISDEEKDFEKQGEAFTDPEETKGNYDYDTIVAEISKILPRIAQQIYIDTRVDELKQLAL